MDIHRTVMSALGLRDERKIQQALRERVESDARAKAEELALQRARREAQPRIFDEVRMQAAQDALERAAQQSRQQAEGREREDAAPPAEQAAETPGIAPAAEEASAPAPLVEQASESWEPLGLAEPGEPFAGSAIEWAEAPIEDALPEPELVAPEPPEEAAPVCAVPAAFAALSEASRGAAPVEETLPPAAPQDESGMNLTRDLRGDHIDMAALKDELTELLKVDGVHTAVVVSRDGFVIEGASTAGALELDAAGAVVSAGIANWESIGKELHVGAMAQSMVEYEAGIAVATLIGKDAILAVVAELKANLGNVRYQIKKRAAEIEKLV
jgi:predicted regulator of Ras-like GTPase activity (Roadblock/LC7/MglB family)